MKEVECVVSGKVWGVGFRAFTKRKADALWLPGFAENLPNKSVRVVAHGSPEKLEVLINELNKGPFLARVSNVSVSWREPTKEYNDFSIRY